MSIEYDFQHDGQDDKISLIDNEYQVQAIGKCFYYGYNFGNNVDSHLRSEFIKHLKSASNLRNNKKLTDFIQKTIDDLHRKINLYNYDLVVMPESSSRVNQYMLRYIYRFAQPSLYKMELIKKLPERIIFEDGRMRHTESQNTFTEQDEKLCASIRNHDILIIDDITASGSTLNEVLRVLRSVNEENNISIFSMICREDLFIRCKA